MENKDSFKVPYGLDRTGKLVPVVECDKQSVYKCPNCHVELLLKQGEVRSKHFAHPVGNACTKESMLHQVAKQLVAQVMEENALGQHQIQLTTSCSGEHCSNKARTTIDSKMFVSADVEVAVGRYRCDVVGQLKGGKNFIVEVVVTNPMEAEKCDQLKDHRWVELDAADVIRTPLSWLPRRHKLNPSFCKPCSDKREQMCLVADEARIDRALYSAIYRQQSKHYVGAVEKCYKCHKLTPVFWWAGVPHAKEEPPEPRPKSIQWRNSKAHGEYYWANTCVHCRALQGDDPMYSYGGVLSHLPVDIEEQNGSVMDVMKSILDRNFGRH